jgi:hypothetical protein
MSDLKQIFDQVIQDKIRNIPGKAKIIETAKQSGRLLAVRGAYDYVERVVPHCYAGDKKIIDATTSAPSFQEVDAIFVGCPGKLSLTHWQKPLLGFLDRGGVLLTTDWCLGNFVEKLFPNMVRRKGSASGTFPLRVLQPKHPLLSGIPDCGGTSWVVEAASHKIEIVDPKRVATILDAPNMGEPSAVLVAFEVGNGLVVHAISHFHLQGSDKAGEYVSAYILTNVIDEAIRRRYPDADVSSRVRVTDRDQSPPPLRIKVLN